MARRARWRAAIRRSVAAPFWPPKFRHVTGRSHVSQAPGRCAERPGFWASCTIVQDVIWASFAFLLAMERWKVRSSAGETATEPANAPLPFRRLPTLPGSPLLCGVRSDGSLRTASVRCFVARCFVWSRGLGPVASPAFRISMYSQLEACALCFRLLVLLCCCASWFARC